MTSHHPHKWRIWADFDEYGENGASIIGTAEGNPLFVSLKDCTADQVKCAAASPDLLEIAKQHRHLLSELHAGNVFSKDHLWKSLTETEAAISKAGAP